MGAELPQALNDAVFFYLVRFAARCEARYDR
ncbi:hypothetical protein Psta_2279 [Pirellula staleyi DSM 6068]|uniref:Uncharacterized protein n=1 Tax=Pirellula staleyi (strain ATCC 27377 / DSM 6068 / ICPB 4128) TaxID=530564 RepID=D2R3J5_PIRSD|nr:hypothetical protein Psta_2279 [Pirellula staleyi DSM 6068]